MSFKTKYPDFAAIEHLVRRAQAERAVALATTFADAIFAVTRGLRRLAGAVTPTLQRGRSGALVVKASVPRAVARY